MVPSSATSFWPPAPALPLWIAAGFTRTWDLGCAPAPCWLQSAHPWVLVEPRGFFLFTFFQVLLKVWKLWIAGRQRLLAGAKGQRPLERGHVLGGGLAIASTQVAYLLSGPVPRATERVTFSAEVFFILTLVSPS